jgi:hypothetical protein
MEIKHKLKHPLKNSAGKLLTTSKQFDRLVSNDKLSADNAVPVVYWYTPYASAVWLLNMLDDDNGLAFGLCDIGMGFPEIGSLDVVELLATTYVERNTKIILPELSLALYASAAKSRSKITIPKIEPNQNNTGDRIYGS